MAFPKLFLILFFKESLKFFLALYTLYKVSCLR